MLHNTTLPVRVNKFSLTFSVSGPWRHENLLVIKILVKSVVISGQWDETCKFKAEHAKYILNWGSASLVKMHFQTCWIE